MPCWRPSERRIILSPSAKGRFQPTVPPLTDLFAIVHQATCAKGYGDKSDIMSNIVY